MASLPTFVCFLLLWACAQGHPTWNSWSSGNATPHPPPASRAQDATAQALVYGYPLTQYMMVAAPISFSLGVNNFLHRRVLSTAAETAVIRPNEDTLYSNLVFDLSHGDVIINFADIPEDQFHLMTYYDPYGNVLATLGTGYHDVPGKYCIRQQPAGAPVGLDTNPSPYEAYINSPTTYGSILMRLVVNATNLDALHVYQNQTTSQNVSSTAPAKQPYLLNLIQELQSHSNEIGTTPNATETIMGLVAAFNPYSPPLYQAQVRSVDNMLSAAGVSYGTYTTPAGVDLGVANATAEETIENSLYAPGKMIKFANSWSMVNPQYASPDFGTHYAVRALVARTAYLLLKPPNTVYPVWTNVTAGENAGYNGLAGSMLHLHSGEALIYDFTGGRPPLQTPGFWSLTIYDADGYLIQNSQGTYRLGDRDNLTYSDGALVYPVPEESAASKPATEPFQVLVQAADAAPPANWTSNWLPSPAGGGNFTVLLRVYGTTDELLSGKYVFPEVQKIAAFTNATSSRAV